MGGVATGTVVSGGGGGAAAGGGNGNWGPRGWIADGNFTGGQNHHGDGWSRFFFSPEIPGEQRWGKIAGQVVPSR